MADGPQERSIERAFYDVINDTITFNLPGWTPSVVSGVSNLSIGTPRVTILATSSEHFEEIPGVFKQSVEIELKSDVHNEGQTVDDDESIHDKRWRELINGLLTDPLNTSPGGTQDINTTLHGMLNFYIGTYNGGKVDGIRVLERNHGEIDGKFAMSRITFEVIMFA